MQAPGLRLQGLDQDQHRGCTAATRKTHWSVVSTFSKAQTSRWLPALAMAPRVAYLVASQPPPSPATTDTLHHFVASGLSGCCLDRFLVVTWQPRTASSGSRDTYRHIQRHRNTHSRNTRIQIGTHTYKFKDSHRDTQMETPRYILILIYIFLKIYFYYFFYWKGRYTERTDREEDLPSDDSLPK